MGGVTNTDARPVVKMGAFPVGAWVCDPFLRGCGTELRSGEIVSAGRIGRGLSAYVVKFGERRAALLAENCVCYVCGAPDDQSHAVGCVEPLLRARPHTPGYAA